MVIGQATEYDYLAIYELVRTAFRTARVSDGAEQEFVYELRARPGYRPELELVAEEDGRLAGHVLLTEQAVGTDKPGLRGLLVAPLCVRLDRRGRGLGAALLHDGLRRGRNLGYTAAFLVGDPAYYGRMGFQAAGGFGLVNATEVPDRYVLARALVPGALEGVSGGTLALE